MPYLADLLPFMVIFERTLWRQSGPPAYHHQEVETSNPWWHGLYQKLSDILAYANLQFCRFVQKRKKKEKKKREKRKKVLFDGTPWRDCLLLSYQKSQVSKDSFQQIFQFWFERRPRNCAIVRHGPRDEAERKSWNVSSVIGSFGDQQQKIQYFWFCRQKLVVCSEIPSSKSLCHMETSQLICSANQMTGFYLI